jgi:hypothetical protein
MKQDLLLIPRKGSRISSMSRHLPRFAGAARALEQIRDSLEEGQSFEDLDPQAFEAVGTILKIMRGEIIGRNIQTRLSASMAILYQYRGRPVQRREVDVGGTLADLIERSMSIESRERKELPPANRSLNTIDVEEVKENVG